jgi:hypothetical protein
MLSVLQIADLHRSSSEPVSNTELVATIVREHDAAITEGMRPVDAIVVCGDLIQGCTLGAPKFAEELIKQYAVAEDLLRTLVKTLLRGDIGRLIVVPGNHDVCWNTARAAMVEATPAEHEDAFKLLMAAGSAFRWDWSGRKLYRIADAELYSARLNPYRAFFEKLYGASQPDRICEDAWLFSVGNVQFVGFQSCVGTDCFNHSALIQRESIAQAALALHSRPARLRVAVWHHNTEGPPNSVDYLDQGCIRQLVYRGFRLGLHGHQHYAATQPLYIHTDRDEMMAIVAAASLCAGKRDLPIGRYRGFNFIHIDEDDKRATVTSLAMDMESRVQPEYAFNGGSAKREVSWTRATTDSTTSSDATDAVLKAERARGEHRQKDVIDLLTPIFPRLIPYGRALLLEALLSENDFDHISRLYGNSFTAEEAPQIIMKAIDAKQIEAAEAYFAATSDMLSPDARSHFARRIGLLRQELGK